MRTTRHGGPAILLMLVALLVFAVSPVSALTLQRSWSANLGTSGRINVRAYTDKTGSIQYSLKSLRKGATYTVQIRYGTCASLGSLAARLTSIRASSTGTLSQVSSLSSGTMYWVWKAARRTSFVVRLVSGTSVRCGNFTFAHATRVAVPSLGINLPVIRGPSGYPPCKVAMYSADVAQPREPGITFIFAHARIGMFLPLLTRWKIDHGASMIGHTIEVWTSDSVLVYYRITRFRVTSDVMAGVTSLSTERLWLQTSTGPNTSYPKLIVEAVRYKTAKSTYSAAHPTPHPISC
jgi:sortase (surface protein transpeptidase)